MMKNAVLILGACVLALVLVVPAARAQKLSKVPALTQVIDSVVLAAIDRVLSAVPEDAHQVEPETARRLLLVETPVVIDVRDPAKWQAEPLLGAINIPLRDLTREIARLPVDMDTPILVYCQNGIRGTMAMTALRTMGYTNVYNLRGGLDAWTPGGTVAVNRFGK
jgi:rhodanese-related sulfurtransferase